MSCFVSFFLTFQVSGVHSTCRIAVRYGDFGQTLYFDTLSLVAFTKRELIINRHKRYTANYGIGNPSHHFYDLLYMFFPSMLHRISMSATGQNPRKLHY